MRGPVVTLSSSAAQALALALHELAANALVHGALSQVSGRLSVTWEVARSQADRRLSLEWRESGVAMPCADALKWEGFGGELIRRALPYQLHAATTLQYGADGVRCTISAPL